MQLSQIPRKFETPFAASAGPSFINFPVPAASQVGVTPGAASLFDGFPPLNFTPTNSGGVPPRGVDFNGLLYQITAWNQWTAAGGAIPYDATFQATVGGYPNGAVVASLVVQGNYWQSTVDNNTTNPDAGGAGWINPPGMMGTGDWKHRPVAAAVPGWLISNGTTISNAGGTGAQRANADCLFAFQHLWNNFSNTDCPVSGGRGATAAADFVALKTIGTLNMQGIGVTGVDGMGGTPTGLLAGVPIITGSATLPGSILGANLQGLVIANMPIITPAGTISNGAITSSVSGGTLGGTAVSGTGTGATSAVNGAAGITVTSSQGTSTFNGTAFGSNTAHNNVQRSMLVYWFMKL